MTATHGEGAYGNGTGVTTPTDHKMAQVTEFVKTGVNLIRPGLLWDGSATVVTGKANMSYDVRAFSIVTQRSATSGVMKWANDATVNVVTTAAPGSNSRYDVVYAWHREFSLDGTNSDPVIGVIQGTSAASPTVPALTAVPGAVELARILVPAGVTATNSGTTITQTAPFTAAAGGVIEFRTISERDAATVTDGQLCHLIANEAYYSYLATATTPGWFHSGGKPVTGTITFTGIFSSSNASLYNQNGRWVLDGLVVSTSATFASGTTYTLGSISSANAPLTALAFICTSNTTAAANLTVDSTGTITMVLNQGFTSTLALSLGGASWRDRRF